MAKSEKLSKYRLKQINHHRINRTVIGNVQTRKGGELNRPIIMNVNGNLLAGDLPLAPTFPRSAIQIWRKNKINFQLNHCVMIHQLINKGVKFKPQEIDKKILKNANVKNYEN